MRRLGCRRSKGGAPEEALQRSDGDRRARAISGGPKGSGDRLFVRFGRFHRVGCQVSSWCPFTFTLSLKLRGIEQALPLT